ncbi:THAP domain [Popillia japonica]|uniref:THAP domain n=1 Tax=Popillia japonica TaxID=7064 RepID=A0AAW1MCS8_POPJA
MHVAGSSQYIKKCIVANSKGETSSRYRFPVKNEQIKKIWIDRINNDELFHYSDQQLYNTVFVCGAHFLPVCKTTRKLAAKALPTINMPGFHGEANIENSFFNEKKCGADVLSVCQPAHTAHESKESRPETLRATQSAVPEYGLSKIFKTKEVKHWTLLYFFIYVFKLRALFSFAGVYFINSMSRYSGQMSRNAIVRFKSQVTFLFFSMILYCD